VVDWIAFTPEQVRLDLELFAETGHYVFISSASAYQKPPTHPVITESTPLFNPFWQYSRDKIACEEILNEAYRRRNFPITIVRPSLTYGPTQIPASFSSWNHPWTLVDRMRRGQPVIVPGDGSSLWTMTHNSDFAVGFLGLLGNQQAVGHSFHVTSDELLTWDQIYQSIGQAAGVEPRLVHISSEFIAACAPDEAGGLLGDKARSGIFDNSKIKRLVPGYVAVKPFFDGVRESVRWFEDHPERQTVDAAFNDLSDRLVRANEAGLAAFQNRA